MDKDLLVSIIIPVIRQPGTLGECLEAVRRQDYSKREIVVVHDSSSAKMPEIPHGAENVRVVSHRGSSRPGPMINAGMTAARGHIRVLLMPHCIPVGPGWLEQMVAPFHDSEVGVSVSACYAPPKAELTVSGCLLDAVEPVERCSQNQQAGRLESVSHLADAYRAELLADIGYFEVDTLRSPGEAVEVSLRVQDAGYSIVRATDAAVEFHPPAEERSMGAALSKALDYGFTDAVLESRYGMRWINSGIFAAALLSLLLLPLAVFSIKAATALSLGILVWGFFLGVQIPHINWELPVAALNFAAWALVIWLIRDDWWAGLFGKEIHPSLIRQWCWFGAVTASYLILLGKAALGSGLRAGRRRGFRYALPVLGLSALWWLTAGVGYVHGRLAAPGSGD